VDDLRRLVYTGYCTLEDKKPGAVLREVLGTLEKPLGPELIFNRKSLAGSSIGSVYEVEKASETSWRLTERKYVGKYHDTAAVAEWQLKARAAQLTEDALKAERSAAKDLPAAFEYMEPLRRIYAKQLPNGKRAIEVLLLEYLRRGM
jgi:hypothetical protein